MTQPLPPELIAQPNQASLWSDWGARLLLDNQPSAAIAPLQQAIVLAPEWAIPYNNLAEALFRLGAWRGAAISAARALAFAKANPDPALDPSLLPRLHHLGALSLAAMGHHPQAIAAFESLLSAYPETREAVLPGLLVSAIASGDLARAAPLLPAILAQEPEFVAAVLAFGQARSGEARAQARAALVQEVLAWPGTPGKAEIAALYRAAAQLADAYDRPQLAERHWAAATERDGRPIPPRPSTEGDREWATWQAAIDRQGSVAAPATWEPTAAPWAERFWQGRSAGSFAVTAPVALLGDPAAAADFAPGRVARPPESVVDLTQGRICARPWWGVATMVGDCLLGDFSPCFPLSGRDRLAEPKGDGQPFLHFAALPTPQAIDGWAVAVAALSLNNYSHWLTEFLPAWGNLLASGCDPAKADAVWLPGWEGLPFQAEVLDRLGISPTRRLGSREVPHLAAKRLTIASLPGYVTWPTPEACHFARDWLQREFAPVARGGRRRLYISRDRAGIRRVLNEDEVLASLEPWGFERVFAEDLDLGQQVALFAEAEAIVAPHGAGLTNVLVCAPGTLVVELFAGRGQTWHAYWLMAQHLGLRYAALVSEVPRSRPLFDLLHPVGNITADMWVEPRQLENLLRSLL